MRILVTGASGLVGTALTNRLRDEGHEVLGLMRRKGTFPGVEVAWDPAKNTIEIEALEDLDGVVHLAGENIATGRWTPEKKRRILESRVLGTQLLCDALAHLNHLPKVLVSASAIGYYGDRGAEELTEDSVSGTGFLAEVCQAWESAAMLAETAGVRVVRLRTGVVLSSNGGALARMLPPFQWGLGGVIGDGNAYMSWIVLEDLLQIIQSALLLDTLHGPVNAVAPNPVTNREFTKALGNTLHRPTLFPLPAFAVRMLFGEMGREMLLASARVMPHRLMEAGFSFRYPSIEGALGHVLKMPPGN